MRIYDNNVSFTINCQLQLDCQYRSHKDPVESRFNAVQYHMISHISLQCTPYLELTDYYVFCKDSPRYNSTALYVLRVLLAILSSTTQRKFEIEIIPQKSY